MIELGKSSWKIVKGAMVIAHGTKSGTLYITTGYINMVVAESTSNHVYDTINLDI